MHGERQAFFPLLPQHAIDATCIMHQSESHECERLSNERGGRREKKGKTKEKIIRFVIIPIFRVLSFHDRSSLIRETNLSGSEKRVFNSANVFRYRGNRVEDGRKHFRVNEKRGRQFRLFSTEFSIRKIRFSPLGDKNLEGEQYPLITNEESDEQAPLNQHFGGEEGGGGRRIHCSRLSANDTLRLEWSMVIPWDFAHC